MSDLVLNTHDAKHTENTLEPTRIVVSPNDYIIVQLSKPTLCYAHNPQRNTAYVAASLDDEDGEAKAIQYNNETLIANLGPKPKHGKLYGVEVETLRNKTTNPLGQFYIYRSLEELESKALLSACRDVYHKLKHLDVFPIQRIDIREKKGKYAGSYAFTAKGDDTYKELMTLRPASFTDLEFNNYLLLHEIGHKVWFTKMDNKMRCPWVGAYNHMVSLRSEGSEYVRGLFDELCSSDMSIQAYVKNVCDEDLPVVREILAYLRRHYRLGLPEINILLANDQARLGEIWPASSSISTVNSLVSEYSKVNVLELFAEAFAFHMQGKTLPASIKKLMEETLDAVQTA